MILRRLRLSKVVASLLPVQSLLLQQGLGIRLVIEDEEAALVHAQGGPLGTKLKAEISQERVPSDFEIVRMTGIPSVVTEKSGGIEGIAVVDPKIAMTGNVIEMIGVIGRADAAAPDPRLAIESVTGSIAAIDATETGNVVGTGTAIENAIERGVAIAIAIVTEIVNEIVIVIELIGIAKGTATEIETETAIGIVTASWTVDMIVTLVVIWIAVAKGNRHENDLQKGTEIVAEKKGSIVTDHEIEMTVHDQDLAVDALHPIQIVLAHDIVVIGQALAFLLVDDLTHEDDHALQISQWTLIGMSQLRVIAADLLDVECVLLNARKTENETVPVSKNGTESLVETGTSLELLQETANPKQTSQAIGIVSEPETGIKPMKKIVAKTMIGAATRTVTV